jgi:hypothetical protein
MKRNEPDNSENRENTRMRRIYTGCGIIKVAQVTFTLRNFFVFSTPRKPKCLVRFASKPRRLERIKGIKSSISQNIPRIPPIPLKPHSLQMK